MDPAKQNPVKVAFFDSKPYDIRSFDAKNQAFGFNGRAGGWVDDCKNAS